MPTPDCVSSNHYKQVIVMRKDLNLRKGKMVANGAHASIMFLVEAALGRDYLPDRQYEWISQGMTKICVGVDSEQQLLDIADKATLAGLEVHVITDAGRTEFHGVPTKTCLAIGPDDVSRIDAITGDLKLL